MVMLMVLATEIPLWDTEEEYGIVVQLYVNAWGVCPLRQWVPKPTVTQSSNCAIAVLVQTQACRCKHQCAGADLLQKSVFNNAEKKHIIQY